MRILRLTKTVEEKILGARRGQDREAQRVAARIVEDVRRCGDAAVFSWTQRLDRVELNGRSVFIPRAEMRAAAQRVSREFLDAVDHAARNIRAVARKQLPREWSIENEPGVRIRQVVRPIDTIGCYIPGGRFSLVSSLLMTAIPAQVAGVKNIIVASPQPGDALLAVAETLGLPCVARIGGAQAIAALACGTRSIPRVDKIFGPGNRFVTAAKFLVSADCPIDLLAGPTEAIVLADRGNPKFIAADLLAQAEHDPAALALFVTTSVQLGRAVAAEIKSQLAQLPKSNPAWRSMARNGAVILTRNAQSSIEFVNRIAPEHLTMESGSAAMLDGIHSAGSVFQGDWSAQTFGDYASGTNHVLPTSGLARARGGLSTADFVKCISVQEISRGGFRTLAPVARELARAEGLAAHARSIEVRE
ncbi:MAG TPA: histidinol dehydrogenase [Candidatus Acidoferrales bacterium]